MNGRVYDYNLGRFMSVDPVIQSPTNSQSINPYSYIMNNPLSGTDPTGYACAASRIESTCDKTLSHWGGNGKADASFSNSKNSGNGASKPTLTLKGSAAKVQDLGSQLELAGSQLLQGRTNNDGSAEATYTMPTKTISNK